MKHWSFRSADAKNATPLASRHDRLALGVERVGLLPLRFPVAALIGALVLMIAAAFGAGRLKVDDSLSQLFRSDTPEFRQFEEVTRRFPSSEFDVLLVVEGQTLLQQDSLQKLRESLSELQLVEGVRGVISLFSARQAPKNGQKPGPLFPGDLPQGAEYDRLIEQVQANEIIRGKLLSADGQLALVVIALDPDFAASARLSGGVAKIREAVRRNLAGSGLRAEFSGVPVMQLEIRNAVEQDRLVYNGVGFAAGCLIAILFFRRASFMIIAAGPPLIAILLALGTLGWLDFRLNMFLNVMTPLIMVISFSDSMQLTFAARDRLLAGEGRFQAFRNAVLVVGPACVLTHATAGLSFVALLFSSSELIRTFGEAGILSTVIALGAVLMILPLLGVLLAPRIGNDIGNGVGNALGEGGGNFSAHVNKRSDVAVDALRFFCAWIAARMVNHSGLYSLVSVTAVALLAILYAGLEPRYRLADQVPDQQQAVQASHRIDAKLTGSNPVDILIEFPAGASLYAPETLEAIAQTHAILEKQAGVGNVWSLETLRRWLIEKAGISDRAVLRQYAESIPEHLRRRFIAASQDAVVVSGRIPDVDASQLLPVVDSLDGSLEAVRAQHPGYRLSVTGLAAIAARNSATMIGRLNQALTIEIVFVAAFIGLAFRSFVVMLASILPGIFPILISGDILWLTGNGLQFASIIALTVSFGLGLSATIHFLNRLRLEDSPLRDPATAVERATVLVGPALILTSIVLACGLAVTAFSNLPSLRLFGWLSAFAMLAALAADLLILRPTITWLRKAARRLAGRRAPLRR